MAEQKTDKKTEPKKPEQKKEKTVEKKKGMISNEPSREEVLIRILGKDIPGSRNVYVGLTRIKGVSWSISNVVCRALNLQKNKKIAELTKDEVQKIEEFLKNPTLPNFLKNRRIDRDTNESRHHVTTELDMKKDFDIRRLKKIRSYKGVRHTAGQPVRGQRTRAHFRSRGKAVGVKRRTEAKTK